MNTMVPKHMPQRAIDFHTVVRMARQIGDVEEATMYGSPAIKVCGKLLAGIPVNPSAEPHSLGVRISIDDRAELIAAAPEIYYVTDHYVDYPVVLVRLHRINPEALKDLLRMAFSFVTRKTSGRKQPRKRGTMKRI